MTNKALFLKWIKTLFFIQCVVLVVNIIGQFSIFDSVYKWVSTFITIAEVYCFYQLKPVHKRYEKAFIFAAISVAGSIVSTFISLGVITLGLSICGLIAIYHEFSGHAEMLLTIDNKLSNRWRTLFNWNVFGSLIVAFMSAPFLMIAAITTLLDYDTMEIFTTVIVVGYSTIIQGVYIYFLKCTHDICERYEHWIEE